MLVYVVTKGIFGGGPDDGRGLSTNELPDAGGTSKPLHTSRIFIF